MPEQVAAVERVTLETPDVRVATTLLRRVYADHTAQLSGDTENFSFGYVLAAIGGIAVDLLTHTARVRADVRPLHQLVVVQVRRGRLHVETGQVSEHLEPGDVLLIDPMLEIVIDSEDVEVDLVRVDLDATRTLGAEISSATTDEVLFRTSRPLSVVHSRHWSAVVDHVQNSVLAHDEIAAAPLARTETARLLATTLLTTFPNTTLDGHRTAEGNVEPSALRRAVEFIDTHAHLAIGIDDIASAARLGPRALQYAFRRHRDQTPLGYLRQVRLEKAHHDLRTADPSLGDTVSAVAARWGFTHAGRFSSEYRRVYGQSPSHRLRT